MVACLVHYSFTTKYYLQFARLTCSWQYCRINQFRVEDSMNVWRHSFCGDRFRQTETYSDEDSDICNIMRQSLVFNAELPTAFTLLFRHGVFIKVFQLTQVCRNESVCMSFNYYQQQSGRGSVVWLTHVFVLWSQRGRQTETNRINKSEDGYQ